MHSTENIEQSIHESTLTNVSLVNVQHACVLCYIWMRVHEDGLTSLSTVHELHISMRVRYLLLQYCLR